MARPKGSKNKAKGESSPNEAPEQAAAPQGSEFRYSQQDLNQYKREADRYAEQSKEANGNLGSFTNTFIDRTGADKAALSFWRRVMRMDRIRGDMTIRHFIHMLTETNRMPEPDLVDKMEGGEGGRASPMARAPAPPSAEEIGEENGRKVAAGIKPLEGSDAQGSYVVN